MRYCFLVLCSLAMVGCLGAHHAPTSAPASALRSDTSPLAIAHQQLNTLQPEVKFTLKGADAFKEAHTIADELLREGKAVSFAILARGGDITLRPTYADNEIMLHAYRNPAARNKLTPQQRQALAIAEDVVKTARHEYQSDYDVALALHDYLVERCAYESGLHGHDSANATARLLLNGRGVCDSYTRAYQLMLSIAGIENQFVAGVAQGDNHCWNLVKLNGCWTHVDCTYSDPMPDEQGRVYHTHFAMPDYKIARDHTWNRAKYPKATARHLYYPLRFAHFATVRELVAWGRHQQMVNPKQYITAYVDELSRIGNDRAKAQRLIEHAHLEEGTHVMLNFALEEHLPGVIVCKCLVRSAIE